MFRNKEKGFTVVELLVSMAIFAIVISIASTVFIRSLRAQRAVVKLIEVNENTSITIERMAREIRTGTGFPATGDYSALDFTNARGEAVEYSLSSDSRIQGKLGNSRPTPLTGRGVYVKDLNFAVNANNQIELITITLTVGLPPSTQDIEDVESRIQTTVSVRPLNSPTN